MERRNTSVFVLLILCNLYSVVHNTRMKRVFPQDHLMGTNREDRNYQNDLNEIEKDPMALPIEGVVGRRVDMPCDITPSRRDDTVYMVLWFRNENTIPFYSLDVRGKHYGRAKHWSADTGFGRRAHFLTVSDPARLTINETRVADSGIYRCRVDFRNSPSRETRLNLTVTVPPRDLKIYEDSSGHSVRGQVGPYREGSTLRITCIAKAGTPKPKVLWYLNDEPIDSTFQIDGDQVINLLELPKMKRFYHGQSLQCRTFNTLLIPPITKTVTITLNLRPLTVNIENKKKLQELSANNVYEILCESWGSHPPPEITWWLDGREIPTIETEISRSTNNSLSRLLLRPNASNDGQLLTCRTENMLLPGSALEDSWRLRVVFFPNLQLRLGSSLNPQIIREGDDVYFECHIQANPPIHRLQWFHNDILLRHNQSIGIILSNQSLVLQRVTRSAAGNYSCQAMNEQGSGFSNHVALNIMYSPTCKRKELSEPEAHVVIAASKLESVNISCEMDALPKSLTFRWSRTNTVGESSQLPNSMFTSKGSQSFLQYPVESEEDFGTLLCWASNAIGSAPRPCVFQLVPAEIPHPVENCSIINRTSTSVEITCQAGFDGGLPQSFLLETIQVAPRRSRGKQFNVTSTTPSFSVTGLDFHGTFHFRIYSINRKGRSRPVLMDDIALHYPVMQSAKAKDLKKTTIAILIGVGSAIFLGVVSMIGFVIHRIRNPIISSELEKSYSREFNPVGEMNDEDNDDASPFQGSANNESTKDKTNLQNRSYDNAFSMQTLKDESQMIYTQPNRRTSTGRQLNETSNPDILMSSGGARHGTGKDQRISGRADYFGTQNPDPFSQTDEVLENVNFADTSCQGFNSLSRTRINMDHDGVSHFSTMRNNGFPVMRGTYAKVIPGSNSFHDQSSNIDTIDTRLIGQQLASEKIPESCV